MECTDVVSRPCEEGKGSGCDARLHCSGSLELQTRALHEGLVSALYPDLYSGMQQRDVV